jgi:single-strand DNA-binding protein
MTFIEVIGHVGRDPETRFTPNGKKVTSFSVASNKKRGGQDVTDWYRITVWGDQFEKMMPFIKKGSGVIVKGELDARIYTDKEGHPQVSLDVTAFKLDFLPSGKTGERTQTAFNGGGTESFGSSEPFKGGYQAAAAPFSGNSGEDDLPF